MPKFFDTKSGILYDEGQCPNEHGEGIEEVSEKMDSLVVGALEVELASLENELNQNALKPEQRIVKEMVKECILNELLKELAPAKLRRSYASADVDNLPQFFSKETKEIIQGTFVLPHSSNEDLIPVKEVMR